MAKKSADKPIHEIVLPFNGGLLKAALWKHQSEGKRPHFSVVLTRAYKTDESSEWQSTSYLQRDDMLAVGRIAELAHAWIVENSTKGESDDE